MHWWVLAAKFRNFWINMTLPIVEQVTFLPWWLQSRVSKNVAKGKTCCCWLLLVNVWFEHIWIKEVNYHLSMESHFWSLNIEMVSSIYKCVKSNLCRIQIHSGTVCGIRFGWYFQHATSRLFCLFFFLRTCTDEPMVFFHELYEVSVFVLIIEMISFISL